MEWLWHHIVTILVLLASCCSTKAYELVIVNVTDTARFSFNVNSGNDLLLAPNGDIIAQKTGDSCSLVIPVTDRYQLLNTDCTANLIIFLTNVTLQDAGFYKTSKSSEQLIVLESPKKPIITANKQNYKVGDSLTLVCETVSMSRPKDHRVAMLYQWYRQGIFTRDTGSSLLLTDLQSSDFNTTYNCIARDQIGPISTMSDNYYLLLEFKGSLQMSINGVEDGVIEPELNDTLVFRYTPHSYPLVTEIHLKRNDLYFETLHAPNFTKVITTQCRDNGEYEAYFIYSPGHVDSNNITVKIPCPASFRYNVPDPYLIFGTPEVEKALYMRIVSYTEFTCQMKRETESGLLPLSPMHDVTVTRYACNVHFRNLDKRLYGKYKLLVQNDFGNFTGNLIIVGPPSEPKNLIAWSTTPNSIHLVWEAGNSYSLVPTYKVIIKQPDGYWEEHSKHTDSGRLVTIIASSLLPQTKYSFLVHATISDNDYGFYSNLASTTTIGMNDEPQPRPESPDQRPTEITEYRTTPGSNSNQPSSEETTLIPLVPALSFETGVGLGLAVGIVVAILAVIVTVVVFKRKCAPSKVQQPIPDHHSDHTITSLYDIPHGSESLQRGYQELRGNENQDSDGLTPTYLSVLSGSQDGASAPSSTTSTASTTYNRSFVTYGGP